MNDTAHEHVLATMVEDLVEGRAAPDLTDAILSGRARVQARRRPRGRLISLVAGLAAAAALALSVYLVATSRPAQPLPQGVLAGPAAVIEADESSLQLVSGWALITSDRHELAVREHRLRGERFAVHTGGIPDEQTLLTMSGWLDQPDSPLSTKEIEMLTNAKNWIAKGSLALCVLSGTVLFDGVVVEAQKADDTGKPDKEIEAPRESRSSTSWEVKTVADAAAMPTGTTAVFIRNATETEAILKALPANSSVKGVRIDDSTDPGEEGLRALTAACPAMQHLSMARTPLASVAGLATARKLMSLQVESAETFNGAGLADLQFDESAGGRNEVAVTACPAFDDAGMKHLAKARRLQLVVLSDLPRVTAKGFEGIKDLRLTHMHVTRLAGFDAEAATHVAAMATLTTLTVSDSKVFGNEAVEKLAGHQALTSLYLNRCAIGTGIGAFVAKLPVLRSLAITGSDTLGVDDLRQFGGLNNLRTLSLAGSKGLSDDGLAALAESSMLTSLNISNCASLTNVGVLSLASMKSLKTLNAQTLPQITDDAWATLQSEIPGLTINK
ncbi:MAG: hypothetical protein IPK87_07730 [Planctomycetes bacterium]|nr:hypothetical protein [Planctomycetota bacterium]